MEYLRVGLKGMNPSKAKWIEVGRVRELYPHLHIDRDSLLEVQKLPNGEVLLGDQILLNFQSARNATKTVPLRPSCLPDSSAVNGSKNRHRMKKLSHFEVF